jgi:hypothetical protein
VEIAERLKSAELVNLIQSVYARLVREWRDSSPDIDDGIELLRALDGAAIVECRKLKTMQSHVQAAILGEASKGCRANQLRELIGVIDTTDKQRPEVIAVRSIFKQYEQRNFSDDLFECRSPEQFDGLLEDLQLFRNELSVDVATLLEKTEEARMEFVGNEEAYADDNMDHWRERSRLERNDDRAISEMFGSLKDDRD